MKPTARERARAAGTELLRDGRVKDLTLAQVARHAGVGRASVWAAFRHEWPRLRREAMLARVRRAMTELERTARTRLDLSAAKVAARAGVSRDFIVSGAAHSEWRTRRDALPTVIERIERVAEHLVVSGITHEAFTLERLLLEAGVRPTDPAASRVFRRWYTRIPVPAGGPGPVDPTADVWDLRDRGGEVIRRDQLRGDFRALAWDLLRTRLQHGDHAGSTVTGHHRALRWAGDVLGRGVPDIRRATLEAVQKAWLAYRGTLGQRRRAKQQLVLLFEALAESDAACAQEFTRITAWLGTSAAVRRERPNEDHLRQAELLGVVTACAADIRVGIELTADITDLELAPTNTVGLPVARWTAALALLLCIFTGLRRESLVLARTTDIVQVAPGVWGMVWRHGKKDEEHLAIVPEVIARNLRLYAERTTPIRRMLGGERLFIGALPGGHWAWTDSGFIYQFRALARRHDLRRDGKLLRPSTNLLRRTFVTMALREGRSIFAIAAQLGHTTIATTITYAKWDEVAHAAEVAPALDELGRLTLGPWAHPIRFAELDPKERQQVLARTPEPTADALGSCRFERCVKIESGPVPACSLREHLVSGPAFLPAWERERAERAAAIEVVSRDQRWSALVAQLRSQLQRVDVNIASLRGDER